MAKGGPNDDDYDSANNEPKSIFCNFRNFKILYFSKTKIYNVLFFLSLSPSLSCHPPAVVMRGSGGAGLSVYVCA